MRPLEGPRPMDDEVNLPERCVKVVLDERTGVFGPDGLPVSASCSITLPVRGWPISWRKPRQSSPRVNSKRLRLR